MKKVLVFGIFDGLHPGHISFLKQAKKHGDFLIVAVGRASVCKKIKCKIPKRSLEQRIAALRDKPLVNKAVPGDIEQGSYKVILRENPNIICLGYDQQALASDLKRWLTKNGLSVKLKTLKPYRPRKYHTSILRPVHTLSQLLPAS